MLALAFLQWWYGAGWLQLFKRSGQRLKKLLLTFSVPALIMTLFDPWRRVITYGGESIGDKMRAMVDNLVSRCVGFAVRIIVIITALVSVTLLFIASAVEIILWPLLPVLAIALIIRGFLPW